MTRETKIGLLVGLAFIIVIGILLSDHMTSTTDPPKAPLSVAGANVRESVAAPTSPQAVAASATAPPAVAPVQPVLTQQEVLPQPAPQQAQRPAGQSSIQVGPAVTQAQPPTIIQSQPQPPVAQGPAQSPDSPVTIAPPAGQRRGVSHPLQDVANQHGEEIVPFGSPGANSGATGSTPAAPMAPLREYKAQAGDSLSKLAGRFLGANTKANREAIVRANATLQQNPDRIIEGRTYLIPAPPAANSGTPVAAAPAAPSPAPAPAQTDPAAAGAFTWYTVKENDSLWRIASDQLGTGTAVKQIKELNADVLKGSDNLQVGTRLRIPPKPVASVN